MERTQKDEGMSSRLSLVINSQDDLEEGNHLNFLNLIFHIYKIKVQQSLRGLSTVKLKGGESGLSLSQF